jgi:hypothetical protein
MIGQKDMSDFLSLQPNFFKVTSPSKLSQAGMTHLSTLNDISVTFDQPNQTQSEQLKYIQG